MWKGFLIALGVVLAIALVAIGLKLIDESEYRSCLAEGGRPEDQALTTQRIVDQITGEVPRKVCRRGFPF